MTLATMDALVDHLQSYAGNYQADSGQDVPLEQDISGLLEAIRTGMTGTPVNPYTGFQQSTGYDYKAAPERPHVEKNILYGYAAYHRDATGNEYVDSYGDITTSGSWQACIQQWERERQETGRSWLIPHLCNHSKHDHIGAVMLLREDQRGVYYESKLASTAKAQEVKQLASDGMLQCSYGYVAEQVEHVTNAKTGKRNRRLLKVFVNEISALSGFAAANPYASTHLKSLENASHDATDALQAMYRRKLSSGILRLGNMTLASLIDELERIAHG